MSFIPVVEKIQPLLLILRFTGSTQHDCVSAKLFNYFCSTHEKNVYYGLKPCWKVSRPLRLIECKGPARLQSTFYILKFGKAILELVLAVRWVIRWNCVAQPQISCHIERSKPTVMKTPRSNPKSIWAEPISTEKWGQRLWTQPPHLQPSPTRICIPRQKCHCMRISFADYLQEEY